MFNWDAQPGPPRHWIVTDEEGNTRKVSQTIVKDCSAVCSWNDLQEQERQGGLRYAIASLARQALHSQGLREKLRRHYVPDETIEAIVASCIEHGWINDSAWTASQIAKWERQGKSKAEIRARLYARGVKAPKMQDDQAALEKIIPKKYPALLSSVREEQNKAIRALLRRGFSFESIQEYIRSR